MIHNLDNSTLGPDSREFDNDSTNIGEDFNNVNDNYDPNDLDSEEDIDLEEEGDDILDDSEAAEPDLDEDEIERVFPNADDDVPDPDDVDGTADFDEETDANDLEILDEDDLDDE
jgi:hypothetical protein